MRRTEKAYLLAIASVLVMAQMAFSATISVEADAWGQYDKDGFASVWVSGENYLVVSFGAVYSLPASGAVTLVADASGQGSVFAGDYTASGIKSVSLRMRSETAVAQPVGAMLIVRGLTSGRVWRNENVQLSGEAGKWVTNTISFNRSAGWKWDGPGDLDALWDADLKDVALIGIRVGQNGTSAKTYSIDDFVLLDVDGSPAGEADLVPSRVLDYFSNTYGVVNASEITDEMKNMDSDGDGMNDWDELWSGTNPNDANSVFAAELVEDPGTTGITIQWSCITGGKYVVLKATSLMSGFSPMGVPLTPTPDEAQAGFMTCTDESATGEGPYFYRVLKQE